MVKFLVQMSGFYVKSCSLFITVQLLELLSIRLLCSSTQTSAAECILCVSCCPFTHVRQQQGSCCVNGMLVQPSALEEFCIPTLRTFAWGFACRTYFYLFFTYLSHTYFSPDDDYILNTYTAVECGVSARPSVVIPLIVDFKLEEHSVDHPLKQLAASF